MALAQLPGPVGGAQQTIHCRFTGREALASLNFISSTKSIFSLHRPPAHCFLNGKICEARGGLHMLTFKVEIGDSGSAILLSQAQPTHIATFIPLAH